MWADWIARGLERLLQVPLFWAGLLVLLPAVLVLEVQGYCRHARANAATLAKLLRAQVQSNVASSFCYRLSVAGLYHGTRIEWDLDYAIWRLTAKAILSGTPTQIPGRAKRIVCPTTNTHLVNGRIRYYGKSGRKEVIGSSRFFTEHLSEHTVRAMLEELRKAVEIVEAGVLRDAVSVRPASSNDSDL